METSKKQTDRKAIFLLSSLAGILGGLCCLTPIVLVLFGLATISGAASLGMVLYGEYRWVFRAVAFLFLALGLVVYFRQSGICTREAARRERNRLINVSLLAVFTSVAAYVFWTYVLLHYWGIAAGLPWAQYDESWAIPLSIGLFASVIVVSLAIRRAKPSERSYTARVRQVAPRPRMQ